MPHLTGDGFVEGGSNSTLHFGNLHPAATARCVEDLCTYFGSLDSVKVVKDKSTGSSSGCVSYGFVKFSRRADAESAARVLNGRSYMGQELRVCWALPTTQKEDTSQHFHLFVGDLSPDVTEADLFSTFSAGSRSCSDARVVWDASTGHSKGYGFVSFRLKEDAEAAMQEMQGRQIGSRAIRVGWAQRRQDDAQHIMLDCSQVHRSDPTNTNVYVGNLAPETSEADLTASFAPYGPISEIKLHRKGGYGFVKYRMHDPAVQAIVGQHGKSLNGKLLKCSWGKNNAMPGDQAAGGSPLHQAGLLGASLMMPARPSSRGPMDAMVATLNAAIQPGLYRNSGARAMPSTLPRAPPPFSCYPAYSLQHTMSPSDSPPLMELPLFGSVSPTGDMPLGASCYPEAPSGGLGCSSMLELLQALQAPSLRPRNALADSLASQLLALQYPMQYSAAAGDGGLAMAMAMQAAGLLPPAYSASPSAF